MHLFIGAVNGFSAELYPTFGSGLARSTRAGEIASTRHIGSMSHHSA